MDYNQLANDIIEKSGGKENFAAVTNCMTRVRIKYRDESKVDMEGIKALPGILGILNKETVQLVVGPGKSTKLRNVLCEILADVLDGEAAPVEEETTGGKKKKGGFLKALASIFVPLLPAIIASGVIMGLNNILVNFATNEALAAGLQAANGLTPTQQVLQQWGVLKFSTILANIGSATFAFLAIYCGVTSARVFKVDEILGGLVGALTLAGNLKLIGLGSGQGGLFGVILAVWLLSVVHRFLTKVVPDIIAVVIVPVFSIAVVAAVLYYGIMPFAGVLSNWLTDGIMYLINVSGVLGGFVLSALFPTLIASGLHHGLTPIHMQLINDLGLDPIFPVQIMSNAGMVGAAIAVFVMSKNKEVRAAAKAAIPTSFLAVGEPTIFGVNIPAGFAFITGSIGSGFGGIMIRLMDVNSHAIGSAGMSALPMIAQGKYLQYLLAYAVGCGAAFALTFVVGKAKGYK